MIPTQAFRLILSLNLTSCENHQVETTDGFLSGECKHKRVRNLREHSKPKPSPKWQESIQGFLFYVAQALLLLLMVSPTTKALLLLLPLSSCFYLCSLAIAHNFLFQLMFSLWSLLALLHLLALSWCYSHFSSYGSRSPPPTCVILISPIKYSLYYLVLFPSIALNVLSLRCSMVFLLIGSPFMFCHHFSPFAYA